MIYIRIILILPCLAFSELSSPQTFSFLQHQTYLSIEELNNAI